MNKKPYKKRYSSYRSNRKKTETNSTLSNQISAAIILCAFILIIAYTNSSATNDMRTKMTAMISKNVMDEFADKGNFKDNIESLVKSVFSKEDEDTDSLKTNTEPVINNTGDEDNKEPEPSADDGDSSLDTPPT